MPAPLLSSFSLRSLTALRRVDSQIALGWLLNHWPSDWQATAQQLDCVSIHLKKELFSRQRAAAIKQAGFCLICYTVNSPQQALQFADWGVDAVITDFPDSLYPASYHLNVSK